MKKVLFLSLKWEATGGYPSYVRHLFRGINMPDSGWIGMVASCTLANQKIKDKSGLLIKSLAVGDKKIKDSIAFLQQFDAVHLIALPYGVDKKPELAERLYRILNFSETLFVTLHDPAVVKSNPYGIDYLRKRGECYFFHIGEMAKDFFEKSDNFNGEFIRHPYYRFNDKNGLEKENLAINTSRIDFDKFTHLICEAGDKIKGKLVFHSHYKNAIYYWHYLKGKIEPYLSSQPFDIKEIYSPAKVLIDMSKIQHDGNRTQYTILEAIDFEVVPIVRRGWFKDNPEFKLGENYLEAETPEEIAEQTNRIFEDEKLRVKIITNNKKVLVEYDAGRVAQQYIKAYEKYGRR